MRSLDARKIGGLLLPYLALVAVHLASGLRMEQPLILADELGYLGNARYLAGVADLPNMAGSQFYHFGYSLFLVPAFWLFDEPAAVYRAAVVVNALLVSTLYFALGYILAAFARVPAGMARGIAFACCLYPSLVLYSSFAWSENAFTPFYAVVTALFGRYLVSRSTRDALLVGLAAGFLYTIHPRALPVLAAVLVYFLALAVWRAIPARQLALSVSAMGSVFLATRLVNLHLKGIGWGGGGEVSAVKLAERLLPDSDLPALIERALGQALYVLLASHGLALVGLAAMVWAIVRAVRSGSLRRALVEPTSGVPLFILSTATGVFAAATTLKLYSLHGVRAVRGADFIHGRYNEPLVIFAVAFALAELCRRGVSLRRLALRVAVVAAVVLCFAAVVQAEIDDALVRQAGADPAARLRTAVLPTEVDAVAVPAVHPLVVLVGSLNLYRISLLVLGSFLLLSLLLRFSWRGGLATLVLLFAAFAYDNQRSYLLPLIDKAKPRLALAAEVRRLGGGGAPAISYDTAFREPGLVPGLQFLLQRSRFERFDSDAGQEPATQVVVAGANWPQAGRLGARFVRASGRGSAVWLLPGELRPDLPVVAWQGRVLGSEPRADVRESGFYRQESFRGEPGRWTNGAASLSVPLDPADPPRRLEIELLAPRRAGTRVRLVANEVELYNGRLGSEAWEMSFGLERVPLAGELHLEIDSDTFSPAEVRSTSRDRRRLGVVVKGVRLIGEAPAEP